MCRLNLVKDFRKWLAAVKSLDDEKRFERDQAIKAFEQSAAASRASSRDANTQNALSGPSRKANAAATASTTTAIPAPKADYPTKLTEDEKRLLLKYDYYYTLMGSPRNPENPEFTLNLRLLRSGP
jgi:hypothetical protein